MLINSFEITNSTTTNAVMQSAGDDNIDINITPKGTGLVNIPSDEMAINDAVTATSAQLNFLVAGVTVNLGTAAVKH